MISKNAGTVWGADLGKVKPGADKKTPLGITCLGEIRTRENLGSMLDW
jgi:hypothetical protein